eukprot:symbB.v1.2.014018.t1/scaffold992.1/size262058/4
MRAISMPAYQIKLNDVLVMINGCKCVDLKDCRELFELHGEYVELVFTRETSQGPEHHRLDQHGWEAISNYFKLSSAFPPGGLYHNVLRLRWGAGAVLFLVLGQSDLLQDSLAGGIAVEAFRLAVQPMFVPLDSVVAASKTDAGRSCTSLCESIGKVCYSGDLLYLNLGLMDGTMCF